MKKRKFLVLTLMFLACLFFINTNTYATSKVDKAYNSYVKKLKKTSTYKNGIYTATVSVKNQNKLLLVTTRSDSGFIFYNYVHVYQYYKGKVKYIGEFYCSSSAYSILNKSGTLVGWGNHDVNILNVKNGKGYWTKIDGYYLYEGSSFTKSTWTLKNNKKSSKSTNLISEQTALSYSNKYKETLCKNIKFKKR